MKIEIWSDVACPWCYIGKKRFEKAMMQFPHADKIEVEWKSFLLNPHQKTDPADTLVNYLSREKAIPVSQVEHMMSQVSQAGKNEGIDFRFEKVVVANTVRAHALLQVAREKNAGARVKQQLLQAYFEDQKNVDTADVLLDIAEKAGLDKQETRDALSSDAPFVKVEQDLKEAQDLSIQGVPFFVIDRKYGISGAQESEIFTKALETAFTEWQQKCTDEITVTKGPACSLEGDC